MKETMHGILLGQHVVKRFNVNENIRYAKAKKANVPGRDRMYCSTGTEMKWSEGHDAMWANQ